VTLHIPCKSPVGSRFLLLPQRSVRNAN